MQDPVLHETPVPQPLDKYTNTVTQYERSYASITVTSDDDLTAAAEIVKELRAEASAIEKERKELVKPFNDGVKAINAKAKAITAPLNKLRLGIEGKMLNYQDVRQREAERKRKEEEEAALAAAQKAETEGAHDVAEKIVETAAAQKKPDEVVRSTSGPTTSVRKTWTYSVEDISKVPREYLVLDATKVRASIVQMGVREIPGLKIFQERKTVVR